MVTVSRTHHVLASLLLSLAALPTVTRPAMAEPIGWMERYALAADCEAVLEELIPGSDDHYFYHCLHYQTTGQLERSEATLKEWLAEHKGRETPAIQSKLRKMLHSRQQPAIHSKLRRMRLSPRLRLLLTMTFKNSPRKFLVTPM